MISRRFAEAWITLYRSLLLRYGYLAYKRTDGNLLFVQRQLGHAHPMVTAVYAEFVDHPYNQLADQIAESKTPLSRQKPVSRSQRT